MLKRIISAVLAAICCLTFTAFTPLPTIQDAAAVLRKELPESMTVPENSRHIDGTKADWERFQSLLKNLSLDRLKSFDIIDWTCSETIAIPREISLLLLEKLKTLDCTVKYTTTEENPPTGGGWNCALQTVNTKFSIFYNGRNIYITVPAEKTTYGFLSLGKGSDEVGKIIWALRYAYGSPSFYQGEQILSLYALDREEYITSPVPAESWTYTAENIALIPENTAVNGRFGLIVFTQSGKHYLYFDDQSLSLIDSVQYARQLGPNLIQWFTHMSTDKITRITFDGFASNMEDSLLVDTTDRDAIERISLFLKHDFSVIKNGGVSEGQSNFNTPGDLFTMNITFNTGVEYRIYGYRDSIFIYSTDLDKTVWYECPLDSTIALRDCMESMPQVTEMKK